MKIWNSPPSSKYNISKKCENAIPEANPSIWIQTERLPSEVNVKSVTIQQNNDKLWIKSQKGAMDIQCWRMHQRRWLSHAQEQGNRRMVSNGHWWPFVVNEWSIHAYDNKGSPRPNHTFNLRYKESWEVRHIRLWQYNPLWPESDYWIEPIHL